MIVETIFSTLDVSGNPNFAPMGIEWGDTTVIVRPYRNTQTCRNLLSGRSGVANISDDILGYVRTALYGAVLPHFQAKAISGIVYSNTCSWREMETVAESGDSERAEIHCRVLYVGRQKEFIGFRRASNAVLEATIMATRKMLYDPNLLKEKLAYYQGIVEKTGDASDKEAFQLIRDFLRKGA